LLAWCAESVLEKNIQKGKTTVEERDQTLSRLSIVPAYEDLGTADFVVEVR
jgi:3-hydroxyacyl-CoA dehydrogenase